MACGWPANCAALSGVSDRTGDGRQHGAPETSLRAGVLAYLVKPFERTRLIEALDVAVKWHEDTIAAGPQPEDTGDRLTAWLESLEVGVA